MDYFGELSKEMNRRTVEGADEQRSDLMTESLEKRDLSKIWEGHEGHLKVVLANSKSDCTRKYRMEKFQLDFLIGKFRKAVFYQCHFEERQVILKAFSAEESYNIPWKELDFLRYLKHPRVIKMLGAFRSGSSFLVLEQCHGNLTHFAKEMLEAERLRLCLQLMEGVDFLHQKSIIHACITPKSILISAHGNLVLSEFSQAIYLKENEQVYHSEGLLGEPAYLNLDALERNRYSTKTDFHACACVIFELELGKPLQRVPGAKSDDIKLYIEVLSIGYPVTNSDNSTARIPLPEIIKQSELEDVLADMIGGTFLASQFHTYPEVQAQMEKFMISLETLDKVIQPTVYKSMWENTPCGPIETSPHLDCLYWNFYYDDNDEPTVVEKQDEDVPDFNCPPMDSLHLWQPFSLYPNLKKSWEEALERGEAFAFEYWKFICREMYGTNEDLLKNFDKWSAHHRKLYQSSLQKETVNDSSQIATDAEPNMECVTSSMETVETSIDLRGLDKLEKPLFQTKPRPATPPSGKSTPVATIFTESTKTGPEPSKVRVSGNSIDERSIMGNFALPIRPKAMLPAWNNCTNSGMLQTPVTFRATTASGKRAVPPPPGSNGPAAAIFTETRPMGSTSVNVFKFPAPPKP